MSTYQEVQAALDRILGDASAGNHREFWRDLSRDEFVSHKVFGYPVLVVGDPERSNLVRALKGLAPFGSDIPPRKPGEILRRMPAGLAEASAEEIQLIEDWIQAGCPNVGTTNATRTLMTTNPLPDDLTHVAYWNSVDRFFLYSFANAETDRHVENLHLIAMGAWVATLVDGTDARAWPDYAARPEIVESFAYLRLHQRRLASEFYGDSKLALFASLWKFGGDLLPADPKPLGLPPRRHMNGTRDWVNWCPYIDLSLHAADRSDFDLELARAWQVGVVADGLLRQRIPIGDFQASDPDLFDKVAAAYGEAQPEELLAGMITRSRTILETNSLIAAADIPR